MDFVVASVIVTSLAKQANIQKSQVSEKAWLAMECPMFAGSSVSRCYPNCTKAERVLAEGQDWLNQKAQAACGRACAGLCVRAILRARNRVSLDKQALRRNSVTQSDILVGELGDKCSGRRKDLSRTAWWACVPGGLMVRTPLTRKLRRESCKRQCAPVRQCVMLVS